MKKGEARALLSNAYISRKESKSNDEKILNLRSEKKIEKARKESRKLRDSFLRLERSLRRRSTSII